MESRQKYITSFNYLTADPKERDTVEKMIGNTLKLHQQLNEAKKLIEAKSNLKTKKPKSLADQGIL
jgi:hypothetical protein